MRAALLLAAIVATTSPGDVGGQARATPEQRLEADRRAQLVLFHVSELEGAARALPANPRSPRLLAAIEWMRRKAQAQAQRTALDAREPPAAAPDMADVSDDYLDALKRATEVLRQAPTAAAVEDVTRDLEAKVDHCRRLGIGMGGTVVLRVIARRDGGAVSDLEVQYFPKFFESLKGATAFSFPGSSSPFQRSVSPGNYLIWARSPSTGQRTTPKLVEVVGQPEIVVDLPVTFP